MGTLRQRTETLTPPPSTHTGPRAPTWDRHDRPLPPDLPLALAWDRGWAGRSWEWAGIEPHTPHAKQSPSDRGD